MTDKSANTWRTLNGSKNGSIPKEPLSLREFSCCHKVVGKELIERMFLEEHIIGVEIEATVIVDDLRAHYIGDY